MTITQTGVGNKKPNLILKRVFIMLFITIVGSTALFYITSHREAAQSKAIITIFTKEGFVEVETDKILVAEILEEADITLDRETQRVFPNLEEELSTNFITIEDAKAITLKVDDEELKINTWAKTISDLLDEQEIILDGDLVNLPLEEQLTSGQEIVIIRVHSELVYEDIAIPAETTYRNDSSLTLGKEKVHTSPKEGKKRITYEVVYNDSKEVSRTKVKEEIIDSPITGIVLRGTQAMVSRSGSREGTKPSSNTGNTIEGIASFYGAELHGNRTASGAPFDMYAMTAAHRTLPFGTKVKVTSLDSGRSVVVVINDRGPHIAGRIIDLSRAAAREIGLYPGIGRVRLEIVN